MALAAPHPVSMQGTLERLNAGASRAARLSSQLLSLARFDASAQTGCRWCSALGRLVSSGPRRALLPGLCCKRALFVGAQRCAAGGAGGGNCSPTSYRYAQTSFATTDVARDAFGNSRATADARVPLSPAALSMAGVLATHGAPARAPAAASAAAAGKASPAAMALDLSVGAESKSGGRRADAAGIERQIARQPTGQDTAPPNSKPHALRHKAQHPDGAGHMR